MMGMVRGLLKNPWPLQEVLLQQNLLAGAVIHQDLDSKAGIRDPNPFLFFTPVSPGNFH